MRVLTAILALSSLAAAASTVNFSGKWTIQVPGRGAQMQQTILVLNHVGNEVTGTITPSGRGGGSGSPITGREILGGKVEGDTITFYVWSGSDRPFKTTYTGTMSGDEITFTVTASSPAGGGMGGGRGRTGPQKMIAKRSR